MTKEKGYAQCDLYPGYTSELGRWPLGESRDGKSGLAKVGNGYVGIYTDTTMLVLWYPLVGEVAHLCRVKSYSNSRAHGIGRVTVWSHN